MSDIPRCYCDSCGNRYDHLGKPGPLPEVREHLCGSVPVRESDHRADAVPVHSDAGGIALVATVVMEPIQPATEVPLPTSVSWFAPWTWKHHLFRSGLCLIIAAIALPPMTYGISFLCIRSSPVTSILQVLDRTGNALTALLASVVIAVLFFLRRTAPNHPEFH